MDVELPEGLDGVLLVDWRALPPARRRAWWQGLWSDVIALADRYRLALRSGWWQDALQVETLAVFCCWLRLYDTGEETDPAGKLQLLWELDRLRGVLHSGEQPFEAEQDRAAFEQYLVGVTGRASAPPPASPIDEPGLGDELDVLGGRLAELRARERTLDDELVTRAGSRRGRHEEDRVARQELAELRRTIRVLTQRESELMKRCSQLAAARYPLRAPSSAGDS